MFTLQHALTLVFVETKKRADALEYWLSVNGFPAIAIHGDKVQMVSVLYVFTFFLTAIMCLIFLISF